MNRTRTKPYSTDLTDAEWALAEPQLPQRRDGRGAPQQHSRREILNAILRGVPDDKRDVFVLHVIEELPMREVADAVGCPLHTAYSRLYAARKLVEDGIRRVRAQMSRP